MATTIVNRNRAGGVPTATKALLVCDMWREIQHIYQQTKRDYTRAYGNMGTYTKIDASYNACQTQCRTVALVSANDLNNLRFLLRYAHTLAHQHGVVVLSLTWLRAEANLDEETLRASLRLLADLQPQMDNDDDECASSSTYTRFFHDEYDAEKEIGRETETETDNNDNRENERGEDANSGEFLAENHREEHAVDDADAFACDDGVADRLLRTTRKLSTENLIFRFFFGKLLFALRNYKIVNYLDLPFHKTVMCVRPDTIARLCDGAPYDQCVDLFV